MAKEVVGYRVYDFSLSIKLFSVFFSFPHKKNVKVYKKDYLCLHSRQLRNFLKLTFPIKVPEVLQ